MVEFESNMLCCSYTPGYFYDFGDYQEIVAKC